MNLKRTRCLSVLMLAGFLLMFTVPAYAFPDIRGHWAQRVITEVSTARPDVIGGYPDGTVRPNGIVTREEFIKMLVSGMRATALNSSNTNFTDVGTRWSSGDIHAAIRLNVVQAREEGTRFRPSAPITREDMARYTVRILGYDTSTTLETTFTDNAQISASNRPFIAVANEKGILRGYPDGSFVPRRNLTRAEAFAVISRFLKEIEARSTLITTASQTGYGNVSNFGNATFYDGWIYYSNYSSEDRLYKIRPDGTGKIRLTNDIANRIFVNDGWIYYGNWSAGGRLYRIQTNGSGRTRLTEQTVGHINVDNTHIYFTNMSNGNRPYRINKNGTGLTMLAEDGADFLVLSGDWLYYTNLSSNKFLYRIRTIGTERTRLNNLSARSINVVGNWVVYGAFRGGIYRTRIDGTETVRINGQRGLNINVYNNKIYYNDSAYKYYIYVMDLDGTNIRQITDVYSDNISIAGGWIYFSTMPSGPGIPPHSYRIRIDGTQKERVQ